MVAADVEEGAQRAVLATYHRDRFVTSGHDAERRPGLRPARRGHDLPRPREHAAALEREAGVERTTQESSMRARAGRRGRVNQVGERGHGPAGYLRSAGCT